MSRARNLLFVCCHNRSRSLTAERMFEESRGYAVKSVGTALGARQRVTNWHIRWADTIFVMEEIQALLLKEQFADLLSDKPVICLGIPDTYTFMQPDLVDKLTTTVGKYLNSPKLKAA